MVFKKKYIQIRNKITLIVRRISGMVRVDKKNRRLLLHEKYEKLVKYILRILTLIGIVSSLIILPIYISFLLSIFLVFLEQILERATFMFYTLYIQPIPSPEDLKKANWMANLFGFYKGEVKDKNFLIGLIFENKEAGKKIFECISSWNNNQQIDNEDNINLSFIIENDKDYSAYLYPSVNRRQIKRAKRISRKGKLHRQLIFTLVMCKKFPYGKDSNFAMFQKEYSEKSPYTLKGFYLDENKKIKPFEDLIGIKKYHLKIKKRKELTQKDLEYEHGRFREMC